MFEVDKKISIAMAKGDQHNTRLTIGKMSFKEFSEFCSKCQKDVKHASYFIRGAPEFEEEYTSRSGQEHGPGYYRHDDAIPSAAFLVIDADHSKVTPKQAHNALAHLDYIHFIYTSHSHTASDNNFRAVIPCEVSEKKYMQATARKIVSDLEDAGCPIGYTGEMGTWSQPWFLPTRDDPDDGIFEHYEYFDGTPYQQIKLDMKSEKAAGNLSGMDEGGASVDDLKKIIMTCAPGMHDALRNLSYQLSKQGMPYATSVVMMQTMMEATPGDKRDPRWQEYYSDLPRMCMEPEDDEPAEKLSIVAAEPEVDAPKKIDLDWPPGLMGQFAKDMYASALYPNKVMCCTAVLGITAGIVARRFNINGMGLNLYITYLMDSGDGKAHIKDYATRILNNPINLGGGAHQFLYPNEFTGSKALLDTIGKQHCGLSIQSEGGFRRLKTSGDSSGLQGAYLDLYTSSGEHKFTDRNAYSNSDHNTPIVRAPGFSMIEESTPDIYLQAMRGGELTGQFNRMFVFRLPPETHLEDGKMVLKMNFQPQHICSEKVQDKIKNLAGRCGAKQNSPEPDASHFDVTREMMEWARDKKMEGHEIRDENPHKASMLQRVGEKALKIAALITLFNNVFPKGKREGLKIDKDAWDWSKHMHEFEMGGLETFFRRSGDDSNEEIIERNIVIPVRRLLQLEGDTEKPYADKRLSVSRRDIEKNQIPMVIFRRVLKNCRAIKDLGNSKFNKSGFMEIIKYMEDNGYAKVTADKKHIKITQLFFENFN